MNCGCVSSDYTNSLTLTLTNETEEFKFEKSVHLIIIYIHDFDKFKKYEISLYPGDYNYYEVIDIIREKV